MRSLLWIAMLVSLALPSLAFDDETPEEGKAVNRECETLFRARDHARLEARLAKMLADDAQDVLGNPLAVYCVGAFNRNLTDSGLAAVDRWALEAPQSHAANVFAAEAWIERGIKVRGGATADKVSPEQFKELWRCARRSKELLLKAEALKPGDPLAPTMLITTLQYLDTPEREVVGAFERAVAARPEWTEPYERMRGYLRPEWFGSTEGLLRFVRAVRDARPSNPRLIAAVGNAHVDLRRYTHGVEYFRDPATWRETRDSYLSYLAVRPSRIAMWGRLGLMAQEAGDDDTLLHAMERYAQLEPDPLQTVDGRDMSPLFRQAERIATERMTSGTRRKPDWTPIPLGKGGRPVADAALKALRSLFAPPPPPAGKIEKRWIGAMDTPHAPR